MRATTSKSETDPNAGCPTPNGDLNPPIPHPTSHIPHPASSIPRLVLASASPRRQELMRLLGVPFEIIPSDAEEPLPAESIAPSRLAIRLAHAKAAAVAARCPDSLIIGADTIVVHGTHLFGKPKDDAEARVMLRALSGRPHDVITGLAVLDTRRPETRTLLAAETTCVEFRGLDAVEIDAYVATGEPFGKAGGYAIQGQAALFVKGIHGDYANVVGLPITHLALILRACGVAILGVPATPPEAQVE
jgi:septum formation protein